MKMLLKRNLLENITIISNSGSLFCVLIHYLTDISLVTGKWFLLYILAVFIVSVFCSFRIIQWLLRLNKPLSYDLEYLVEKYPYLAPFRGFCPELPKQANLEWKEYDTNELSVISTVLERKLVSSWYVPYISQEIGFPFACKQMLDQMIGRTFKICNNIETLDVFVDTCTILILHLKEYDKAIKRHEKSPTNTIESLYKKSHAISDAEQKYTSVEHCTNILRIMIKELLPWELRDTPHSELLVRILSKKLDSYIDSTIANPAWLNDKLMTYLTGEEYVEFNNEDLKQESKKDVEETVLSDTKNTEDMSPQNDKALEIKEETQVMAECVSEGLRTPELIDVKSSPVLRQKRGRQGRNEVKIYDRIIEGSVKTWETDMDLQCISLGQDLLASLDGEITLSRLWGHEDLEGSPEAGRKTPQLWAAGEEEAPEAAEAAAPRLPSPKPAAVLKELQASVSQAKHKIGDLQVKELDVCDASDEAAGMMEGLLDFGIAGLKKGLRFTGLSDDSQEKSPSQGRERDRERVERERGADKSPPLEWNKARLELNELVSALIPKDDNGIGVPPLVKQQHVTSQDSVPSVARALPTPAGESPEPQYEEAADLSTSIAKLRRLLRQRAEAAPGQNSRCEEVWWEGAEETRGRTQHHHSSRPIDTATLADEYDMSMERSSPNQTSNNMQRLDKLFQRTVTGVFNSLKTAVGAEEQDAHVAHAAHAADSQQWAYVHTSNELSVCVVAARLAWSRRARGVEAALDSLQLHRAAPAPPALPEELEEWLCASGRAWSAGSGAAGALRSHVAHRLASLLFADIAESLIRWWLEGLTRWLRHQIFLVFARMEEGATIDPGTRRPLREEQTCAVLMEKMPALVAIFGEETVSTSVHRALSSLSHAAINRDVAFRVLDALALHFKVAAGVRNPSFDTN